MEVIEIKEFKLIAGLVKEVQNLHANLFPDVYKPFEYKGIEAAMEAMFANENCRVFIAKLNDEIIGYMMVLIKEIHESAFHYSFKIIHIDQIAVAEKQQRNGVGEILMQKAE
ncbi:MAG: GNAT family N-acetyltransferase, partial [Bacteroidia bacterium]|nr:GNAT family N-acetyltransferase [Bacteroidia bacterium]